MSNRAASLLRNVLFAAVATSMVSTVALPAPDYGEDILSFDMWCLEMQLYPMTRCDSRRPGDVKDYQQYRTAVEQYQQERANRAKREQSLKQRLDRDPLNAKRDPLAKPAG
ncbi:MAG TPA: hypothetical protein VEU06_06430 [Micropepsaceae bacterium]|nr:hypothetical protein [Micropepsaceae bacterium]